MYAESGQTEVKTGHEAKRIKQLEEELVQLKQDFEDIKTKDEKQTALIYKVGVLLSLLGENHSIYIFIATLATESRSSYSRNDADAHHRKRTLSV